MSNQVQFTGHAMERIFGRLQSVVDYASVRTVLERTSFRNGDQQVTIKTLAQCVRIEDPELINGYAYGNKVVAHVQVNNKSEVTVKTVKLVDIQSKYR